MAAGSPKRSITGIPNFGNVFLWICFLKYAQNYDIFSVRQLL